MLFAEFYHNSTGYVQGTIPPIFSPSAVKLIPACGTDSRLQLDGRLTVTNAASLARQTCKQRKFKGFTINKGSYVSFEQVRALEVVSLIP
jgi:hypothetical protein